MSSFLQFRFIENENYTFLEGIAPLRYYPQNRNKRIPVSSADELENAIKKSLSNLDWSKTGLMLSGGIDSAILAKYVSRGTKVYTLKCMADGAVNEIEMANKYADNCGLNIKEVKVYWEDYLDLLPKLARHMGQPIHSIEPQICKAAIIAKEDGCENLIFGETADIIYGGLDGLLSRDWTLEEFVERHNFVNPTTTLKNGIMIMEPYERHKKRGGMEKSISMYMNF